MMSIHGGSAPDRKEAQPLRLLVDTNVWVDHYLGNRTAATELLAYAVNHGSTLLFAVTSVKDAYYLISREIKRQMRQEPGTVTDENYAAVHEIAWGCIENMSELGTAVSLGMGDIWYAEKLRGLHDDFEDNLILAAAVRVKADFLVTSDEKLQRHSPVAAFSPEDMLTYLKTQE